ncbi:DUF5994 family protein [Actinosynnema pretiosum]|uniref:DUF5994 family protein n=1 Tax=Actinosynnema pretiosum TaxID=42197 RepID=UPI0012FDB95E|nr:DUF5994 family protein [Actinosynnema pretiosum]
MTPVPQTTAPPATERHHPQRLRLRPKDPVTGHVDGAWWPGSRDLVTELPALLSTTAVRTGEIARVSYSLPEWDPAPRRVAHEDRRIRLEGFNWQSAHTVDLIAVDGRRLTLLVVPATTDPTHARRTMSLAVERDNTRTAGELLAAGATAAPPATDPSQHALAGWEAEGGRRQERGSRWTP